MACATIESDRSWLFSRLEFVRPVHKLALAERLIVLRDQLDGDFDAMLILLIVAVGTRSSDELASRDQLSPADLSGGSSARESS